MQSAASVTCGGHTRSICGGISRTLQHQVLRTGDDRFSGIANGYLLNASAEIAAFVGSGPGAQGDTGAAATVTDRVTVRDGELVAGFSGSGNACGIGAGIRRAFQNQVLRAGNDRFSGVTDCDDLEATGVIAAGVRGSPGAEDGFSAAAIVTDRVTVADDHSTARIARSRNSGSIRPRVRRAFKNAVRRAANHRFSG